MKKLQGIRQDKIWGYEDWIASTYPGAAQEEFIKEIEERDLPPYPLLVKIIEAKDKLSVQVHPDNKTARKLEGAESGKSECWYVLDCLEGSSIYYGLKSGIKVADLKEVLNKTDKRLLLTYFNEVKVKKGDFIYIESGTVHALGGGIKVLEVQQASTITYRLYDYERGRKLQEIQGLKAIKEGTPPPVLPFNSYKAGFFCPFFSITTLKVDKYCTKITDKMPVLYFVLEGTVEISVSYDKEKDKKSKEEDEEGRKDYKEEGQTIRLNACEIAATFPNETLTITAITATKEGKKASATLLEIKAICNLT